MRRSGVLVIVLAMFGSACAAADPAPETAPEVEPAQVAVVEEVAVEDHADDEHDEAEDHADEAEDHADDEHDEAEDHADEAEDHADDEHDEAEDHADEAGTVPTADGEFDVEVELVLSEFAFEGPPMEFSPGQTVRFHLENVGAIQHEFRLSNQHRIDEHIAAGHEGHGDEEGHHGETGDVVVVIEPATSKTVDITFPDDVSVYTVVACLLPGHYEAGMAVPLEYN